MDFGTILDSILGYFVMFFSEPRDLVIFATPPMQKPDFRGSEGPNFHVFGASFPDIVLDLVFSQFLLHFGSQKGAFGPPGGTKGASKNTLQKGDQKNLPQT